MVPRLGLAGAATLAELCLLACSSPSAATAQVVTVDNREGELVAPDAPDAPDAYESGSEVEPAKCESIPPADDYGCPDAEFPSGECTTLGQRCLSSTFDVGVRALFTCEANQNDAMELPTWTREAYFYDPGRIPPFPKILTFDTSDCPSRPVIACECRTGETAENAIERNQTISHCQATNPVVFVTFGVTGCPTRAQYDDTTWADFDFDSCLAKALSGVRFDCASSETRVVLMTESKD